MSGLDIELDTETLSFRFGEGVRSDPAERRTVADIRAMLLDPQVATSRHIYTVHMDVSREDDRAAISSRGLGFGVVAQASGAMGRECVRSQGHQHSKPLGSDFAYPEVYEFWFGQGEMYLQDQAEPDVEAAVVLQVGPGDRVVVPPGWVHIVINKGPTPLAFGAWYARDAQLIYEPLRRMGGPAYFPLSDGTFVKNSHYRRVPPLRRLPGTEGTPLDGALFGWTGSSPSYRRFLHDPDKFSFIVHPERFAEQWRVMDGWLKEGTAEQRGA